MFTVTLLMWKWVFSLCFGLTMYFFFGTDSYTPKNVRYILISENFKIWKSDVIESRKYDIIHENFQDKQYVEWVFCHCFYLVFGFLFVWRRMRCHYCFLHITWGRIIGPEKKQSQHFRKFDPEICLLSMRMLVGIIRNCLLFNLLKPSGFFTYHQV